MNFPLLVFLLGFAMIFLLRLPIPFGMMMASIFYLAVKGANLGLVASQILNNLYAKYVLLAIPLFVFTANIMNTGKVTNFVFGFANGLVGRWRGGLGHVNVLASLVFSGMTGSAVADFAGLGVMEIDAMKRNGYDGAFSAAVTTASATIGPVFPPSLPMIVYAMFSGASVGALFLGGMVPGVLLAVALMAYVAVISRIRGYPRGEKIVLRQFLLFTLKSFPALLTPVILLVGIYSGVVTPTEAGALAAFYALLIAFFVYRSLGKEELKTILLDTLVTTGKIAIIVGCAFTFSFVVASEHIPDVISQFFLGLTTSKYIFLFLVNILFLILGMFLEGSTITVVFIPMVVPLLESLGINVVHFGVVVVLNMMIGLSTPPFGVGLFVVSAISGAPLSKVIRETLPMVLVMILVLLLITYIPEIVMFLPNTIGRY
jgi:tripartite ATP-independent transporter DctM subunit